MYKCQIGENPYFAILLAYGTGMPELQEGVFRKFVF